MDYRLYFLSAAGHINFSFDLKADDDEHAIEIAGHAVDGRAMELWRGERQVKEFPVIVRASSHEAPRRVL